MTKKEGTMMKPERDMTSELDTMMKTRVGTIIKAQSELQRHTDQDRVTTMQAKVKTKLGPASIY